MSMFRLPQRPDFAPKRVVWLLPIGVVTFLTVSLLFVQYSVGERHFIPALPLLCICAAQVFRFNRGPNAREEDSLGPPHLWGSFFLALPCVYFVIKIVPPVKLASRWEWDFYTLYPAVLYPLALCAIVALLAIVRNWRWWSAFVLGAILWHATLPGIEHNYNCLRDRLAAQKTEKRFYPLESFRDEIPLNPDRTYYVSKTLHSDCGMLGRDAASCALMFNVFFNIDLSHERFVYSGDFRKALDEADIDNAFLHGTDWSGVLSESNATVHGESALLKGVEYRVFEDSQGEVVFLRKK